MPQIEQPRSSLYASLHDRSSLDQVAKDIFGFQGDFPSLPEGKLHDQFQQAAGDLFGFLYAHVHQSQFVLEVSKQRELSFRLAAWDLLEEAAYELLVGYVLARVGAIPQSVSNNRRSLEVILAAVFLSTTHIDRHGEPWNPFAEVYLDGLWEYYASKSRMLRLTEFVGTVKAHGRVVSEELGRFTSCYLELFATALCASHFAKLAQQHQESDLPPPAFEEQSGQNKSCSNGSCGKDAELLVVDRVPTIALSRQIAKAMLGSAGYSDSHDSSFKELYDRTSGFVHVTRKAHSHGPSFDERPVLQWAKVTTDCVSWMSRTSTIIWTYHRLGKPELVEWMDRVGHEYSSFDWAKPENKYLVCRFTRT